MFASRTGLMALGVLSGLVLTSPSTADSYILATATTGGTYYPVGVALATLTKIKLEPEGGPSLSAISSAGSAENIKMLREGQVGFAILQGIYGAWARDGSGGLSDEGPQAYLRAVTALWPNVEHWVVRKEFARTGTAADFDELRGKGLSIGARNSGTEGSGRALLANLGYSPKMDFKLVYQGYEQSADGMQNRILSAANLAAGPPVPAVSRLFATMKDKVRLLSFTDEQMIRANTPRILWTRYVIPAGTYPGQTKPVRTLGQTNFLAVHENVSEADVYKIVSSLYANLPFIKSVHKATADMSLEVALAGLPVPLHPGALRFYKEAGLDVATELLPPEYP
ncbi:MAG: TAXI family TRAP transporter solute-binding subunit [Rhodospirillaceae bacterium]